jgi:AcrR family transcriptional regulator
MADLRDRQGELVRESVLTALAKCLEEGSSRELSMAEIARVAGVSRRTLYRYFPSREALFAAAQDWLDGRVGMTTDLAGPEEIAAGFTESSRRLERRPELVRALMHSVRTRAGQGQRSAAREEAIRDALADVTAGLSRAEASRAAAVIAHLCSGATWLALTDESGLNPEQARQATSWAVDTLIGDLRARRDAPHSNEL